MAPENMVKAGRSSISKNGELAWSLVDQNYFSGEQKQRDSKVEFPLTPTHVVPIAVTFPLGPQEPVTGWEGG